MKILKKKNILNKLKIFRKGGKCRKPFSEKFFCLLASHVADNNSENAENSYENELWGVKICSYLFILKKQTATDYQATFINLFCICVHT
jgi:hypothetical protein